VEAGSFRFNALLQRPLGEKTCISTGRRMRIAASVSIPILRNAPAAESGHKPPELPLA
jgi:hypothetical protein